MDPESVHEAVPNTEETNPQNFFNRLGAVYLSPTAAFGEIGRSPRVLIPIIALVVVGLLVGYFTTQKIDMQAITAEQMEQLVARGMISQEQYNQIKQQATATPRYRTIISYPFWFLLMALAIAGVAKLISSVLLGAENRFKAIFSITLFATMAVYIVYYALYILILYFKNPADINASNVNSLVASNLGSLLQSLLGEDSPPGFWIRLARSVDIFNIWKIALLAIGYSAVSQKLKTATAATWLVIAYGIIAVIGSAIGSLFSG